MRVVLDANVFASALMNPKGSPAQAVRLVIAQGLYDLVMTDDIFNELERILFYPKIRKRIRGTDEDIQFWLEALLIIAHHCEPRFEHETIVKEDPDDDKYLIAALESHASYLVSGDQHLLGLKHYKQIKIVTPKSFVDLKI